MTIDVVMAMLGNNKQQQDHKEPNNQRAKPRNEHTYKAMTMTLTMTTTTTTTKQ